MEIFQNGTSYLVCHGLHTQPTLGIASIYFHPLLIERWEGTERTEKLRSLEVPPGGKFCGFLVAFCVRKKKRNIPTKGSRKKCLWNFKVIGLFWVVTKHVFYVFLTTSACFCESGGEKAGVRLCTSLLENCRVQGTRFRWPGCIWAPVPGSHLPNIKNPFFMDFWWWKGW